MGKNRLICIYIALIIIVLFSGCSKSDKDDNKKNIDILYSDITEVVIYNKKDVATQCVQIPLVLSDKIESLKVEKIIGENINEDAILIEYEYCTEYDDNYCYIIYLEYNTSKIAVNEGNSKITELTLKLDNKSYDYKFGKIEVIDRNKQNHDHIHFLKIGTGYTFIEQLDLELQINNDIKITDISTTNGLNIANKETYLKSYKKDDVVKIHEYFDENTLDNINKLYYCYNVDVEYICEDEEYVYNVIIIPVQNSISDTFSEFIDMKK